MRRNLRTVVLIPCILACILAFLIILDKKGISLFTLKNSNPEKVVVSVTPVPESQPALSPDTTDEPVYEPEFNDETAEIPTVAATPVPESTPSAGPSPTEAAVPGPEPSEIPESDEKNAVITYNAVYKAEGDDYTLIGDGNSLTYLILNKKDNSVRQTGYTFDASYAEFPGEFYGPVIGHKNNHFVFLSGNHVVASDGVYEKILVTISGNAFLNPVVKSENRVFAGFPGSNLMCIIDLRDFSVETYNQSFSVDNVILTDNNLCFSKKCRIPAGPYYEFLYTAQDGKVTLQAMLDEITDFKLDSKNNIVTVKTVQNEKFQVDLDTDKLSTTKKISKDRTLYLPAYGDGIIDNLSDIRFINKNSSDEEVVLKVLPPSYSADVYYNSYYDTFYFSFYLPEKENLFPDSGTAGRFTVTDYSVVSLSDNKFPRDSKVKELLFSGDTSIGSAEIYLMEQYASYKGEYAPFEMVYAWIPIKNSTKAYQLYMYVPRGEDYKPYLDFIKNLIS